MAPRRLGKTGLRVTPIAFGAFKIGRNEGHKYPRDYSLPDGPAVERLLNGVLDLGIGCIDTAPAYGLSEERIGRFIAHRRAEFVLSTKAGETFEQGCSTHDFSAAALRASVHRSLERLRTDVIDVLYLHAPADDAAVLRETDAAATLLALRDEGLVRAVGLSGKTVSAARSALDWADVLMVEYHRDDRSHEPLLAEADARDVGIVVKKGLASGRLPAADAIRFVLSCPHVAGMVVGGLNLEHFRENVDAAAAVPWTAPDRGLDAGARGDARARRGLDPRSGLTVDAP